MLEINTSLYARQNKSKLNIVLNVLIILMVAALFFEIIFAANYSGIYVVGDSMLNTLTGAENENAPGGDYVYVDKHKEPTYGDIVVVFKKSSNGETTIIKRVIAMGGDYVRLVRGKLEIKYKGGTDFKTVEESYVSKQNNNPNLSKNNFYAGTEGFFVEEGCLFLLGDNRNVSLDSRDGGENGLPKNFPLKDLYGVVSDWSLNNKKFISSVHKYFSFDLPGYFGL